VGNSRNLTIGKQSGKNVIRHKIIEVTGCVPSSETVAVVVERVKTVYANGRRKSLSDNEFKRMLTELKLFDVSPVLVGDSARSKCCLKVHV
jgi:isopropylmalate/homocitrate/citramalate synthase